MEIYTMTDTHENWESVAAFAEKCSWRAGKYLAELMRGSSFRDRERVFAAFEKGRPVGFCTLTEKDELAPKYPYTPLIGFVFVDEAHRGKRISEKMIRKVFSYARIIGYDNVYIMSGEKGLYEKYGFSRMGEYETIYGNTEQLFVINVTEGKKDKFVSYDKMSKKEKKKIDSSKRGSWNGVDPATKVVDTDKRRYRRKPKHPENYEE